MPEPHTTVDELPEEIDRRLLEADGHVAGDQPCVHCRYDLRTLAAGGLCPECGRPVADSLRRSDFECAPVAWLRELASGAKWLMLACMATLVSLLMALGSALGSRSGGPGFETLLACDMVLGAILAPLAGLIGVWRITRRDPRTLGRAEGLSVRRATRVSLVPTGALVLGTACLVFDWAGMRLTTAEFWLPGAAVIVSLIVLPALLLWHVERLLRRGGSQDLGQSARWLLVLLLTVFLICAIPALMAIFGVDRAAAACSLLSFAIGYVLFLIGCIHLHDRIRRFLSAVVDDAAARAAEPPAPGGPSAASEPPGAAAT